MKRLLDITFAGLGVIIFSPLLVVTAILIKAHDGGSVFYTPLRVGRHKKLFRMIKFRTMVNNADKIGGPTTTARDPRITPIGFFMRKFKLDELPQLFNVLKGEMSLVGPRPEIKSEVDTYSPEWDVIFTVRPGITDLSSIEFRNENEIVAESGIKDPHEAYRKLIQPKKLELQRGYVQNQSLFNDIEIIRRTILAVIGK